MQNLGTLLKYIRGTHYKKFSNEWQDSTKFNQLNKHNFKFDLTNLILPSGGGVQILLVIMIFFVIKHYRQCFFLAVCFCCSVCCCFFQRQRNNVWQSQKYDDLSHIRIAYLQLYSWYYKICWLTAWFSILQQFLTCSLIPNTSTIGELQLHS